VCSRNPVPRAAGQCPRQLAPDRVRRAAHAHRAQPNGCKILLATPTKGVRVSSSEPLALSFQAARALGDSTTAELRSSVAVRDFREWLR